MPSAQVLKDCRTPPGIKPNEFIRPLSRGIGHEIGHLSHKQTCERCLGVGQPNCPALAGPRSANVSARSRLPPVYGTATRSRAARIGGISAKYPSAEKFGDDLVKEGSSRPSSIIPARKHAPKSGY